MNKDNAYLLSEITTVKADITEETEEQDLHTEPVEESSPEEAAESDIPKREDAPKKDTEFEQSVTLEDIQNIGTQAHTYIGSRKMPKAPAGGGSEPARLDETDKVITAQPELHPPFTEVSEESYLDGFDDF